MNSKHKKPLSLVSDPQTYILIYIPIFTLQAVMMAFVPLYCKDLGYLPFEVAVVTAAENIATIFGPPFLLSAKWGQRIVPNMFSRYSLIALLLFLPLLSLRTFPLFFLFWLGVLFFNRTVFALVNQTALIQDARGYFNFSRVRLWGSVAFIAATLCAGVLVRRYSTSVIIWIICGSLLSILVLALRFNGQTESEHLPHGGFRVRDVLPWKLPRDVQFFLASVALLWASHGPYYTYISIHLDRLGWDPAAISIAWSIGVAAEVVVFLLYARFETVFTQLEILRLSLLLTAIRWGLLAVAHSEPAIMALQIFHAFSFATSYVASMKLIEPLLPARLKSGSQAVLMAFGMGAGSLIGKAFAGIGATVLMPGGLLAAYNENAQQEYFILFWASAFVALAGYLCALYPPDPGKTKRSAGGVSAEQLPPEP